MEYNGKKTGERGREGGVWEGEGHSCMKGSHIGNLRSQIKV